MGTICLIPFSTKRTAHRHILLALQMHYSDRQIENPFPKLYETNFNTHVTTLNITKPIFSSGRNLLYIRLDTLQPNIHIYIRIYCFSEINEENDCQ